MLNGWVMSEEGEVDGCERAVYGGVVMLWLRREKKKRKREGCQAYEEKRKEKRKNKKVVEWAGLEK